MSTKLVQLCAVWLALLATAAWAQTSTKSVAECYQCNSATVGEEKCDSTDGLEAKWKKTCKKFAAGNQNKFAEAVGCRKIIQEVDDGVRTIRECAYSGGDANGVKRTGNKGIRIFYYQCSGEGCNSSTAVVGSIATVVLTCFAALLRQ